jgi:shikimate dehydrogenase
MAARHGAKPIFLLNRTRAHALALARALAPLGATVEVPEGPAEISGADLAIQTTSLGFGAQAGLSPAPPSLFNKVAWAVDLVYSPWETEFLAQARAAGCVAFNGFDLLVLQGVAAYEWWTGTTVPPRQVDGLIEGLARRVCEGT